jgi:hypothetical protein
MYVIIIIYNIMNNDDVTTIYLNSGAVIVIGMYCPAPSA